MFAVVSDIHSNLEALTIVLADIEKRGIKTIYLDLIINRTKWCVLGNHDYAVFYEPTNFNFGAEQASFWSREILESEEDTESRNRRWNFLGKLPMRRTLKYKISPNSVPIDFV